MDKTIPRAWMWIGVILCSAAFAAWLFLTPPALLRKVDYIGAAVCHRIPSHSFFMDEHQLPLCQRCTGTFSGALTGVLFQWLILRRRRAQRFPRLWVWALMAGFFGVWGLDGFNSYTTLLTGRPEGILGYAPQPAIRLFSGMLVGMSMSIVLVAAFNQTLWSDGVAETPIQTWKHFSFLLAAELGVGALIFTLEPWLLYPVALYSTAGAVTMFVLLGAMIWTMALNRDQSCAGWREAWLPLVWGGVFAGLIVGGMDVGRVLLTGSIDRLPGM